VERKIILKLVLELKSRGHHSQAGITMNGIMPRPAMKRLMVAFLRVPGGSSPNRTEPHFWGDYFRRGGHPTGTKNFVTDCICQSTFAATVQLINQVKGIRVQRQ
jgi:hypothetical protein